MKWEISITEFKDNGKKYKVTRRNPLMNISETKFFDNKESAKKQLDEWSNQLR